MSGGAASSGRIAAGVHAFSIRVYYEDTDAAGIVYHANYLRFAERARTEMLRLLGFGQERLRVEDGLAFAVARCAVEYRAPARLDDELTVESRLLALRGASLEVDQRIRRGGAELARLEVRVACIDRAGRPQPLPPALRSALSSLTPEVVSSHAR
jgi:acyl-CoA thioester hydrolase